MKKVKCPKCQWEWIPRTDIPKQCPKCKRYLNHDKKATR